MTQNKVAITGFSLARPWPWAMLTPPPHNCAVVAPLRLIYSTWPLPAERQEHYVALHANISWDAIAAKHLTTALGVEVPAQTAAEQTFNVIYAVAQWAASVTAYEALPLRQRAWFQPECHHWVLGRFTSIEPVPCPPGGNFFKLPESVLAAVRTNYGKALKF